MSGRAALAWALPAPPTPTCSQAGGSATSGPPPQPAADQVHGTGPDRGRRLPQANEPVAEPPPLKGREVHPYLGQLLDVLQARFSIIPLLHVIHVVLEPVVWLRAEG